MKILNFSFLKTLLVVGIFSFKSLGFAGVFDGIAAPILPPSQVSVIGSSMGNAVMADGSEFNATSFNPALLSRAPSTVELLQLGINVSNDDLTVYNALTNTINNGVNFDANSFAQAFLSQNSPEISSGVSILDNLNGNFANKALEAGAGDSFAIKISPNVGLEFYESAHAAVELKPGALIQQLTAIPLPYVAGTDSSAITVLQTAITSAINQIIPLNEQIGAVKTDINQLLNGQLSPNQAVTQIGTDLYNDESIVLSPGTEQTLENLIVNNLLRDLAYMNALAYSDTVAMITVNFNPLEDFPLTIGINGKVVRRYFSWANLTLSTTSSTSQLTDFQNDLEQATTRWGVDLGLLYAFEEDLSLGISFQDLIKQSATIPNTLTVGDIMYGVVTDPAPTVTNIGLSWHPIHEFVVNADLDDVFSTTSYYYGQDLFSHFKMGSSLTLAGILQLRGGLEYSNFVGGLGIQLGFLGLDYSYGIDPVTEAYNHYAQIKLVF
jgi:hypothetical protein